MQTNWLVCTAAYPFLEGTMTDADVQMIAAERQRLAVLVGRLIAEAWLSAQVEPALEEPSAVLAPRAELR